MPATAYSRAALYDMRLEHSQIEPENNMVLDVSFGIFAFLPGGWIFMAFVILIECFVMTKLLLNKWIDWFVFPRIALSNIISGAVGIIISLILNGGWWLIVWFPWVSSFEINSQEARQGLTVYYVFAFILTLLIEIGINISLFKKIFERKQISKTTLIVNLISYAIGTIVLYAYSFN
jgi:hypothetical protein